jgi:hypothetical protein
MRDSSQSATPGSSIDYVVFNVTRRRFASSATNLPQTVVAALRNPTWAADVSLILSGFNPLSLADLEMRALRTRRLGSTDVWKTQ